VRTPLSPETEERLENPAPRRGEGLLLQQENTMKPEHKLSELEEMEKQWEDFHKKNVEFAAVIKWADEGLDRELKAHGTTREEMFPEEARIKRLEKALQDIMILLDDEESIGDTQAVSIARRALSLPQP